MFFESCKNLELTNLSKRKIRQVCSELNPELLSDPETKLLVNIFRNRYFDNIGTISETGKIKSVCSNFCYLP